MTAATPSTEPALTCKPCWPKIIELDKAFPTNKERGFRAGVKTAAAVSRLVPAPDYLWSANRKTGRFVFGVNKCLIDSGTHEYQQPNRISGFTPGRTRHKDNPSGLRRWRWTAGAISLAAGVGRARRARLDNAGVPGHEHGATLHYLLSVVRS